MEIRTFDGEGNLISVEMVTESAPALSLDPAAISAVSRWRSMGFSDDEIIAMAPALTDAVTYTPTN